MENELVEVLKKEVYCDSRIIAEKFGKRHDNVIKSINQLTEKIQNLSPNFLGHKIIKKEWEYRGRKIPYYLLNRKSFSLLVMSFSGDKAFEWQNKFYDAFTEMEKQIANLHNEQWQIAREQGKLARAETTDSIKELVNHATSQGSKNAKFYYATITKEIYKALKFLEKGEKVPTKFRDVLNALQINQLFIAETIASKKIEEGIEKKLHYKEIYLLAKQAVIQFGEQQIELIGSKK